MELYPVQTIGHLQALPVNGLLSPLSSSLLGCFKVYVVLNQLVVTEVIRGSPSLPVRCQCVLIIYGSLYLTPQNCYEDMVKFVCFFF